VRREALIAATLACLSKYGHEGLSVRRISAEAQVSMGLITHHFSGIDTLVAAAYDSLATRLLSHNRARAQARGAEPLQCLHEFFVASFTPQALDPALFRTWLVFWSLVPHSQAMRAVRERTYGETRATLVTFLLRLERRPRAAAFRSNSAAIGLAALMDGLWVELSLNPSSFAATEAVALCDDWVHALAAGAFPGLTAAHGQRARAGCGKENPQQAPADPG
jgi:TetR/AcrR family transcriptional regulator, transcriptional repressor of bet genes